MTDVATPKPFTNSDEARALAAEGSESALVPPDRPRRLLGLDIVRAIAAGAVFLSHIALQVIAWTPNASPSTSINVLSALGAAGAFGVGLFFVLSGLCIHLPMARKLRLDSRAQLNVRAYFLRRFTRIYPPHLLVLILSAGVALALPAEAMRTALLSRPTIPQFIAHVFMVHTFVPGAIYSINGVLWTIALETHFYLLYPLLLIARRRLSPASICLGLLGLSIAARAMSLVFLSSQASAMVDQSVLRRYWEWALGFYLAERLVANPGLRTLSPRLGPAVLFATFVGGNAVAGALPLGGAIRAYSWPFLFAVAIYFFARQRTSVQNSFARTAAWVGFTSYSLYLTHPISVPLISFAASSLGVKTPLAVGIAALLGGILFSTIYFYVVERPFMRRASTIEAAATVGVQKVRTNPAAESHRSPTVRERIV